MTEEPLFKAEDFAGCWCHPKLTQVNAMYANRKFEEWLKKNPQPPYGKKECQHEGGECMSLNTGQLTHTGDFRCMKCGMKLTPTWRVY